MTDGAERARLRTYLTGAQAETSDLAGENWRQCGKILAETAEALRKGATKIRDGEGDGQDGGLSGHHGRRPAGGLPGLRESHAGEGHAPRRRRRRPQGRGPRDEQCQDR